MIWAKAGELTPQPLAVDWSPRVVSCSVDPAVRTSLIRLCIPENWIEE